MIRFHWNFQSLEWAEENNINYSILVKIYIGLLMHFSINPGIVNYIKCKEYNNPTSQWDHLWCNRLTCWKYTTGSSPIEDAWLSFHFFFIGNTSKSFNLPDIFLLLADKIITRLGDQNLSRLKFKPWVDIMMVISRDDGNFFNNNIFLIARYFIKSLLLT